MTPKDTYLWRRESPDHKQEMFGNESYSGKKILRALKLVPVQVRPRAPRIATKNGIKGFPR